MNEFDPQKLLGTVDTFGTKGIIGTIAIGLAAGILAKVVMPGKDPGGLIVTLLIGVGGSYLVTFLGNKFGLFTAGHVSGFIAATVGAILILLAYRVVFRRT